RLKAAYPDAACALRHEDPFQLLVATILSAQCTDERVNKVTPALFARFPDAASMKDADVLEMEDLIRTTGFYHNKTKSLLGASRRIVEAYGGTVPSSMEDLLTLPGVARKPRCVLCPVQSLCPSAPFFLKGGVPPRERAGSAPRKPAAKAKATRKGAGKKRPAKKAKRR